MVPWGVHRMSPTTHLGRKFDVDSISGIRMDVRARVEVRLEETRPFALYGVWGGALFSSWVHQKNDF